MKQLLNDFYLWQGYLLALGMARTAQVKRDARIGEAEAKRDSGIKVKTFVHKIVFKEGASVSKRPLVRERIKLCMLQLIS